MKKVFGTGIDFSSYFGNLRGFDELALRNLVKKLSVSNTLNCCSQGRNEGGRLAQLPRR